MLMAAHNIPIYRATLDIDIIPFGAISDKNHLIEWPSQETVMHVIGFEETYKHAQIVRLRSKPVLDVKLVTLPGLAVMKIFSWNDKYPKRKKDATDLFLVIRYYSDAGNFERIPDERIINYLTPLYPKPDIDGSQRED